MKFLTILPLIVVFASCEQTTYSKTELWEMGIKVDPTIKVILPKDINSGIRCSDYGPGCHTGFIVKAKEVEMILVEFESEKDARREAYRINQYYALNWLLDDVRGEPVLEKFIKKAFKAVRAPPPTLK